MERLEPSGLIVGGTGTVAWVVVAGGPVEVQRGRSVLELVGGGGVVALYTVVAEFPPPVGSCVLPPLPGSVVTLAFPPAGVPVGTVVS